MYDISEGGASGISWSFPVKGMDITDAVIGGINGNTNQPLITLTLRSRNLHERLLIIEALLNNDADNVINSLKDILDAFQGEAEQISLISLLAKKSCNVTTAADKASWVTALEIAKRTYNLNATEKGTWEVGLGIDTKADKTYNLSTTQKNSWFAGLGIAGEISTQVSGLHQDLDTNEFAQIVNAFDKIFHNPAAQATLVMGGGSNSFNLNVTNWKAKLGIGKKVLASGRKNFTDTNSADTYVTLTLANALPTTNVSVVATLHYGANGSVGNTAYQNNTNLVVTNITTGQITFMIEDVNANGFYNNGTICYAILEV